MLRKRLVTDEQLNGLLATYCSQAAVFYQSAPPSQDKGWTGAQYPRMDYIIDVAGDPARNVSMILVMNVWCDIETGVEPEPIEKRVHELLHTVLATPAGCSPYCFAWTRTDAFESSNVDQRQAQTYGVTIRFDILAFPILEISEPDPMGALAKWTKAAVPSATVIGVDEMDEWTVPSADKPVLYWRMTARQNSNHFHMGMWFDIVLAGHVIAQDAAARGAIVDELGVRMPMAKFALMGNKSPLHFSSVRASPGADYLRVGQIALSGRYVVLVHEDGEILNHVYFNGKEVPKYE